MDTIPCPNWRICGKTDCCGAYCGNCYWRFNRTFVLSQEETECPICLENTNDNVVLPCNHKLCVGCFKRSVYGRDDIPEPEYPYPDEQEEPTVEQWKTDPKLIEYNRLYDKWEIDIAPHESALNCSTCRSRINILHDLSNPKYTFYTTR